MLISAHFTLSRSNSICYSSIIITHSGSSKTAVAAVVMKVPVFAFKLSDYKKMLNVELT